ncbi:hypothetical protein JCM11251_003725 [Rhodosporidiobolus azoricus]
MKFNRYLNSHAIDEWRRAYINYRQLKKQIGRAEEELMRLDEKEEDGGGTGGVDALEEERRQDRPSSRRSGTDETTRRVEADSPVVERDLERGRDRDNEADDESVEEGHDRNARGPSQLDTLSPVSSHRVDDSPPASPGISHASPDHSDETGGTSRRLVRPASGASSRRSAPLPPPRPNLSRGVSQPKEMLKGPNRRWRHGLSPSMELEEIYKQVPPQCRKFFTLLDRELDRVSGFYADREGEAVKRYEELSAQWRELQSHKKEYQAQRYGDYRTPGFVSGLLPKHAPALNVPGSQLVRRTLGQRRVVDGTAAVTGPDRVSKDSVDQRDEEDEPQRDKAHGTVLHHGRPEEYANARSKLKLATFEYYRSLGMLKSYRVLNRTGFAKALKKFEKATAIPCAAKYRQKVESANFVASDKLEELIRETEDAFADVFEKGDRKKALERLRDFGQKKRHHFTSWRAGILMGAGVVLMVEGLVLSFKASTRREIPQWNALLQLFGACFLPIFFSLAFFLNLAAWSYARINYVLIFELDVRNRMDYHQFIELPALLFFVLSLFFWAAFNNFWPDEIHPTAYPLAWLVITVIIMFNPLPLLYPSARWWLLRSFTRMITSGLVAVEFRDFFLGDEMNSLYYSVYNLGFLYCTYNKGWPSDVFSICSTSKTWTTPILSALPALWRLGQSIRRYLDSDGLNLHLLNAGKYTGSIVYFVFYNNWRIHKTIGDEETWMFALFIVFASINSIYTSTWDVLMDWSLGHRDVKSKKHYFLRQELGYFKDAPWLYYVVAVINVVLRFSWVFYLAPKPSVPVQSFTIALLEAGRRIMWNTFRVEAEHIGNRDGFRVTRDVALPYVTASSPEATGSVPSDDPASDSADLTLRQRTFAALHQLHASIVKNFRPLTDAFSGTPWISLGRRVDPVERERREVERQDQKAARAEEEDQRRRKDFERRKAVRRKRRGTLAEGGDESSSESAGEGTSPLPSGAEEEDGAPRRDGRKASLDEESEPGDEPGPYEAGTSSPPRATKTPTPTSLSHRRRPRRQMSDDSSILSSSTVEDNIAKEHGLTGDEAAAMALDGGGGGMPGLDAVDEHGVGGRGLKTGADAEIDADQVLREDLVRGDEDEGEEDKGLEEGMREVEEMGRGLDERERGV